MSAERLASAEEFERFRQGFAAGTKCRQDWGLWCWLCGEPQRFAVGFDPLTECSPCYEATYEQAGRLERLEAKRGAMFTDAEGAA